MSERHADTSAEVIRMVQTARPDQIARLLADVMRTPVTEDRHDS